MTTPPTIRVALTVEQTAEVIEQAGGSGHTGRAFAVLSPGSYPTGHGRLVMSFVECPTIAAANDAVDVATGRATARRTKTPAPQAPQEASTAIPTRQGQK